MSRSSASTVAPLVPTAAQLSARVRLMRARHHVEQALRALQEVDGAAVLSVEHQRDVVFMLNRLDGAARLLSLVLAEQGA